MAALAIAFVLAAGGLASYEWLNQYRNIERELGAIGDVLGPNLAAPLVFGDVQAGQDILASLESQDSILGARLLDPTGELFLTYHRATAAADPFVGVNVNTHGLSGGCFFVVTPVLIDGEVVGRLQIAASLRAYRGRIKRFALTLVFVMSVSVLAGLVLLIRMQRLISGPIEEMAEIARQVSTRKNYNVRARKRGDDELGTLVDGFNHMLDQVQRREHALVRAQRELEGRVEERTRELSLAKDEAEGAVRAKSLFLANVSHELRTPMHGVLAFAKLGEKRADSLDPAKTAHYFGQIVDAGNRMLGLVDDLLDTAQLEAGTMEFEFQAVDLVHLVQATVDQFQSAAHEKRLELVVDLDAFGSVNADSHRLMQLLRGLLSNAVRFAPEASKIHVRLLADGDEVTMEVQDEGPGVAPAEIEAIFQSFHQAEEGRTGAGGTGLGLGICREIARAHGGDVQVENVRPRGAIFRVTLSRQRAGLLPT